MNNKKQVMMICPLSEQKKKERRTNTRRKDERTRPVKNDCFNDSYLPPLELGFGYIKVGMRKLVRECNLDFG
jgi:hypothetical protein